MLISLLLNVALLVVLWLFARWFLGLGIGSPYLPVRARDLRDMETLVTFGPDDTVIDLGSGDGRILEVAARRGARVIGYEINPFLVWYSRRRLRPFGERATIYRGDLFKADLREATVICIFCLGKFMPRVSQMIAEMTKPETKIVSFAFEVPGFEQVRQEGIVKLYRAFAKGNESNRDQG